MAHDSHDPTLAEADKPKNGMLFGLVVLTTLSIVIISVAVHQAFEIIIRKEVQRKVLAAPSTTLREVRASEQAMLSEYRWVDRQKGTVRIPLERAKELTLADWAARPAGAVPMTDPAGGGAAPPAQSGPPGAAPPPGTTPPQPGQPAPTPTPDPNAPPPADQVVPGAAGQAEPGTAPGQPAPGDVRAPAPGPSGNQPVPGAPEQPSRGTPSPGTGQPTQPGGPTDPQGNPTTPSPGSR